jgi:hypothetical protein
VSAAPWRSLADPHWGGLSVKVEVSASATAEEVAAIVAAIEALWPQPVLVESSAARRVPTWRFSNRWWVTPLPTRRERPHR